MTSERTGVVFIGSGAFGKEGSIFSIHWGVRVTSEQRAPGREKPQTLHHAS